MALVYRAVPDRFSTFVSLPEIQGATVNEDIFYEMGYIGFSKYPPYFNTYNEDIGVLSNNSFDYCDKSKGFFLFPYDAIMAQESINRASSYYTSIGVRLLEYNIPDQILCTSIGIGNYTTNESDQFISESIKNDCETPYYPVVEFCLPYDTLKQDNVEMTIYQDQFVKEMNSILLQYYHHFIDTTINKWLDVENAFESKKERQKYINYYSSAKFMEEEYQHSFVQPLFKSLDSAFLSQFVTGRIFYFDRFTLRECEKNHDFSPLINASNGMLDKDSLNNFNIYKNNYQDILNSMGFTYSIDEKGLAKIRHPMDQERIEYNQQNISKTLRLLSKR